jgi:hypothetical protein
MYMTSQPLLIAVIVIGVFNLLLTIVLLSRINGVRTADASNEGTPAVNNNTPAPSGKVYAGLSDINGEVAAAISTALHLYKNEYHDFESTVLTINKVSKTYSPWSSKLYGLSKNPR